ncbi:MAG TPA: cation:proton antiporter [Clostridiales bacterium]|nr:cation:proton antiporter [Clostridiales bacterium]
METSTNFLFDLAIILLCANLGGIIAVRFKQPSVLGQILAGLLIGPSVFGLIGQSEFIASYSEIGVLLLMFMAGMETNIDDLKKSAGSALTIATGGVIVPYILGFLVIRIFYKEASTSAAIFSGVILTATSISITIQSLREFNKTKDRVGVNILGAAIIDDVLGIIVLAVVVGIVSPSQGENPLLVIVKIVIFFILAVIIGMILLSLLSKYLYKLSAVITPSAIALICCFLISFLASEFGIAAIIGAYSAGIIFSLLPKARNKIDHDVSIIAYTLFTPVFFANIGLEVNLSGISSVLLLSFMFLLAAIVGKIIGCGLGAKLSKFTNKECLQVGIGMIPRAEVALIVANLGKNSGILSDALFTAAIVVAIGTTLVTPPLLKLVFTEKNKQLDTK